LVTTGTTEAFVKLNAQRVFFATSANNVQHRGVNTLLIDPFACSVTQQNHYDTFASAADATNLKNYLEGLADNSLLVVVTCDEPTTTLSTVLSTLQGLGADVSDVKYRGAFTFVAKKGAPSMTKLDKVLTEAASASRQPFVNVMVAGMMKFIRHDRQ